MRVTVTVEQIQSAFDQVRSDSAFAESVRAMASGRSPTEMMQAFALRPELLAGFAAICDGHYPGGIVERDLKELVILEASRCNACQFCTNAHISIARMLGVSDDPVGLLSDPAMLSARQRLALEYTRYAMTDSNAVPDAFFDQLRAHFTDAEIVEVTFVIGFIQCLNMFNNLLGIRYRGEYDDPSVHAASG